MKTIKVGLGTCGVSAGGDKTYEAIKHEIEQKNIQAIVKETGLQRHVLPGAFDGSDR